MKAIVFSKLGEHFYGSLGDRVERNTDDGGVACEVPDGSLRVT